MKIVKFKSCVICYAQTGCIILVVMQNGYCSKEDHAILLRRDGVDDREIAYAEEVPASGWAAEKLERGELTLDFKTGEELMELTKGCLPWPALKKDVAQ